MFLSLQKISAAKKRNIENQNVENLNFTYYSLFFSLAIFL